MMGLWLVLGRPLAVRGEILNLDEDFSGTSMRDSLLTSAWWDTTSQKVRLHPQLLFSRGSLNTTTAYASARKDNYLLLADGAAGLRSVDISDPDHPVTSDVLACASQARAVALLQDHAFLAVGLAGMQIMDISDPEHLVDRGSFNHNGGLRFANALAISQPAVFLAESDSGVAVFDISDLEQPVFIRHLPTGTWARDVLVSGARLLVADDQLKIFDLTNPLSPTLLSSTEVTGTVLRVTATAGRAFLACGSDGLQIYDIQDPTAPEFLGSISQWSSCQQASATASGDTVFVAAGNQGLFILDASDPSAIEVLGSQDTIEAALQATYHQNLVFLANALAGLKIFEIQPDGLNPLLNRAQSINLNSNSDPISRVKLTADFTDTVTFQVTVDGGGLWQDIPPDDSWLSLPASGTDLRWRLFLTPNQNSPGDGPTCSHLSLTMDRLTSYAEINSISDVPADNGHQVRVAFAASRFDTPDSEHLITEYSLYRRYQGARPRNQEPGVPYPPGQWDFVTTIPADQESQYATVVPTLADSSSNGIPWAVFFVRTRTSQVGLFFDSPVDSGYSVNNLLPAAPVGLLVDYSPFDGNQLSWVPSLDPQFSHFNIYRATDQETPIQPATLFAVTTDHQYFDATADHWFYQLTQVTTDGQESPPAGQLSAIAGNGASGLRLGPNTPNPFNPVTRISFLVADPATPVNLTVFDAQGRKIRTLLDQVLTVGRHTEQWDGTDDAGHACASGVYPVKIQQGTTKQFIKTTLVR